MKSRQLIALVARREVRERVRTKSFLFGTLFLALLPAAAIVIPTLVGDDGPRSDDVALVGRAPAELEAAISAAAGANPDSDAEIRTETLPDEGAARTALQDEEIDAAVIDGTRLLAREDPPEELIGLLRQVVATVGVGERLQSSGLSPDEVRSVLEQPPVPLDEVAPRVTVREDNRPVAFIGVLFIYLMLLTYGTTVASAVLEEKTSRVSEVLLGALRPHQLLAGKVAGVGVVAFLQIIAVALACAVAVLAVGSELDIPPGSPLTFLAVGMWTLLGYGLYACAYAAAGATASRPEEVGNVTVPLTILIMGSYFAAIAGLEEPNGTLATVLSFIPPMAPITMLPRAAVGDVAIWEVPLSVALTLVFTYGLVQLAGRIYAGGILQTGSKVKLRDALRAASG